MPSWSPSSLRLRSARQLKMKTTPTRPHAPACYDSVSHASPSPHTPTRPCHTHNKLFDTNKLCASIQRRLRPPCSHVHSHRRVRAPFPIYEPEKTESVQDCWCFVCAALQLSTDQRIEFLGSVLGSSDSAVMTAALLKGSVCKIKKVNKCI